MTNLPTNEKDSWAPKRWPTNSGPVRIERVEPSPEDWAALDSVPRVTTSDLPRCDDFSNLIVRKPWGHEYLLYSSDVVAVWVLCIRGGCETSMHCHVAKRTALVVLQGRVTCSTLRMSWQFKIGQGVLLEKGVFHGTCALSKTGAILVEIETPPNKYDLIRLTDKYGRAHKGYETAEQPRDTCLSERCLRTTDLGNAPPLRIGRCRLMLRRLGTDQELSRLHSLPKFAIVCLLDGVIFRGCGEPTMCRGDACIAGSLPNNLTIGSKSGVEVLIVDRYGHANVRSIAG